MVEKVLSGHKIEFYDNIEDLPISQFHRYSKYLLVDSGIGDSIQDIDVHIGKILEFIGVDDKKARQEVLNLRQNLFMVANEKDIRNKSTLCLIKRVDGKDWEDFSDSGIHKLYIMVMEESQKRVAELSMALEKAIDDNLALYFPKIFEDSTQKNYCDLLKKRALLQSEAIIRKVDNTAKIEEVTKKIVGMQKVKTFNGEESEEIKFDKQFESMCLAIAKEFGGGVKQYTTMEFYSAYERLSSQCEEMKQKTNRRNK